VLVATRADLVIDQGSRKVVVISVTVEWLNDLTGYSARGGIYASQTIPGSLLADLSPYLTVNVGASTVTLDLPADVSAAWTFRDGYYDMELFNGTPADDVRFVQGDIRVDKEVTT
jgi:hypothetical protein